MMPATLSIITEAFPPEQRGTATGTWVGVSALALGAALLLQSRITTHTGCGLLLPGFVLLGMGMGLVMSPMSTAAMNAVDRTKTGAASGVLAMSRMVGSTFGVGVMGALVTTTGRARIDSGLPQLSATTRSTLADGAWQRWHPSPKLYRTLHEAFISALGVGLTVSGIMVAGSAALAWVLIQPRLVPARQTAEAADELRDQEAAPEFSAA